MKNLRYYYVYESNGTTAPKEILSNELWIDVGNADRTGVFDHHQQGGLNSSFESVITNKEHYNELLDYINTSNEDVINITFHVHIMPDMDCVSSLFIVQRMLERGLDDPKDGLSSKVLNKLLEYVNEIDSGRKKRLTKTTLYAYFCKMGYEIKIRQERSRHIIDNGIELLKLVEKAIDENDEDIDLFEMPIIEYLDKSELLELDDIEKILQQDQRDYKKDKDDNIVKIETEVCIWNRNLKRLEDVKAAVWKQLPNGEDGYAYAREIDHCMLTVYPSKFRADTANGIYQVTIALNPDIENVDDYTLQPFAEFLEEWEQIEEEKFYKTEGRYRRNHSHPRENVGRFSLAPFDKTDDPWYISEKGDIIDTPRAETLLPYERILSVTERALYMVNEVNILRYRCDGEECHIEPVLGWQTLSLGELYTKMDELLYGPSAGNQNDYLLAAVNLDASMLKYNNDLLKSCCLNMVKKSNTKMTEDNILDMDYRTLLYADQMITVLVGVGDNNQTWSNLMGEKTETSPLAVDLKKMCEHRWKLRDIGSNLTMKMKSFKSESEQIKSLSAEVVALNVQMEEDDLITNPIEMEAYSFIKDLLHINELKSSVISSAQLLIENAEQENEKEKKKRNERIQAGIGLISVFSILSALTNAFNFILLFLPEKGMGWAELLEKHPYFFATELIVAGVILILGCVAGKNTWTAWKLSKKD